MSFEELDDPHDGANNDGVSIIDISDIKNPRYCFLNIEHLEGLLGEAVPVNLPLSAEMYVRSYYPQLHFMELYASNRESNASVEDEVVKAIEGLAPYKVLSLADLKETWPRSDWRKYKPRNEDLAEFTKWLKSQAKTLDESRRIEEDAELERAEKASKAPSTLLDSSVLAIMETGDVEDGVAAEKLEVMLSLDHIRTAVWNAARTGKGAMSSFVFEAMIADTMLVRLDLQCVTLPANEFLIKATAGCPSLKELNLSGQAQVTNDVVTGIGSNCRLLQKLVLFTCKNVTEDCLVSLSQTCPLLHHIYAEDMFTAKSNQLNKRAWSVLLTSYGPEKDRNGRTAVQGAWLYGAPLARLFLQWIKNVRNGTVMISDDPLMTTFSNGGFEGTDVVYRQPLKQSAGNHYQGSQVDLNQSTCIIIEKPQSLEKPEDITFKYAFLIRNNSASSADGEGKNVVEMQDAFFTVCNLDEFLVQSYQEVEGGSELLNEGIRKFRTSCREELSLLIAECGKLEYLASKEEVSRLL
ncbi:hypothetical protein BDR26DRAFT_861912 [Obelidium mucronatum]|nr:hypothetical protein BDR26DRAFT_861912 [Obelidium mucronatum]